MLALRLRAPEAPDTSSIEIKPVLGVSEKR
jgi:hypothetical protein